MEKKLRPLHGLILFVLFVAFMLTGGVLLQYYFGLAGIAITEFCLLMLAILFPRTVGVDLKEVFPLTPPPVSKFFGSLVFGGGVFVLSNAVNLVSIYLFPGAVETSDLLDKLITSESAAMAVIVVAILPALCEEMLFRGCLMSALKPLGRKWLIILLVGLAFGIGHFDVFRLLPTGILGAGLAYIGLQSRSIFLGMLLHFILNILSVVSAFSASGESAVAIADYAPLTIAGSAVVYLAFALALIVIGVHLLNGKKLAHRTYLGFGAVTAVLFLTGIGLTAFGTGMSVLSSIGAICYDAAIAVTVFFIGWIVLTRKKPANPIIALACASAVICVGTGTVFAMLGADPPVYQGSIELSAGKPNVTQTFTIEEEGEYIFAVSFTGMNATVTVSLLQEIGEAPLPEDTDSAETDSDDGVSLFSGTDSGKSGETAADPGEEGTSLPETETAEPSVTYLATFEGRYLNAQTRMVHLKPGTYTVSATLTPDEGVKDRDTAGRAIAILRKFE